MNWLSGSKKRSKRRGTWSIIASRASLLGAAVLLAGCSVLGLAYQQLPNLSYWWLDDYFDFNSAQSAQVRNGLDSVAQWHKATQLEPYAALLDQASTLAANTFNAAQACQWLTKAGQSSNDLVAQLAPLAVPVMASLEPRQLAHYQDYIATRNTKWREEQLDTTPQAQLAFRLERTVKQLTRFYGDVSPEQEASVAKVLQSGPYQAAQAFQSRQDNQARVLEWLQGVKGAQPAAYSKHAKALQTLWANSMQWPASLQLQWCQQLVDVHAIMTPPQRKKASETLATYARDLRALR